MRVLRVFLLLFAFLSGGCGKDTLNKDCGCQGSLVYEAQNERGSIQRIKNTAVYVLLVRDGALEIWYHICNPDFAGPETLDKNRLKEVVFSGRILSYCDGNEVPGHKKINYNIVLSKLAVQ